MSRLSDAKRDAILEAGARMFLMQSYSAVSMDAIADAAPVSKPTLYNYFEGKPALFAAVISHICAKLVRAIDDSESRTESIETNLRNISRACVDLLYEPGSLSLFRRIIAEQNQFPELGKVAYENCAVPTIKRISRFLRGIDASSGVHFQRVDESARLLLSMLMGDEHMRCLLGIKVTLSPRERSALVNRTVSQFLSAHHARS